MAEVIKGPWDDPDEALPIEKLGPRRHMRIPQMLPWRDDEYEVALCGQTQRLVDTLDEVTCATCGDRLQYLGMVMESPVTRLAEVLRRERDRTRLSAELTALGMLVKIHRDEFDLLVDLAQSVRGEEDGD